ncbi:hypothetical protein J4401_00490 [Candidatus Woesearchaeota archaeon]|nr:hypothetical protein [Candidatus Woesearchaeota archaeon]
MSSYRKFHKSKKAQDLTVGDAILWIPAVLLLLVPMAFVNSEINAIIKTKLSTHGVEGEINNERIMNSLSYISGGRQHPGIIDPYKLTEENLMLSFIDPYKEILKRVAFKVNLSNIDSGESKVVILDKDTYEDVAPLLRLKYLSRKSTSYVLIADNNGLSRGILEITEFYPK